MYEGAIKKYPELGELSYRELMIVKFALSCHMLDGGFISYVDAVEEHLDKALTE